MRRKWKWGALLLSAVLLAGCGSSSAQATQKPQTESASSVSESEEETAEEEIEDEEKKDEADMEEATASSSSESASSEEEPEEETTAEAEEEAEEEKVPADQVFFDGFYNDAGEETAKISGMTELGDELWTVQAGKYSPTQLLQCAAIGVENDMYYYIEGGSVVALDLTDGSVKWKNDEFGGASPAWTFDEEGNLYLCGYYGPDLFVVTKDGKTRKRVDQFSQSYYWPYYIELTDDLINITYESNETTLQVDKKTFSLSVPAAPVNGYSNGQLKKMAIALSGAHGAYAEIYPDYENEYAIHVFYEHPDYIETVIWYWVNPATGEGVDINGQPVNLREASVSESEMQAAENDMTLEAYPNAGYMTAG